MANSEGERRQPEAGAGLGLSAAPPVACPMASTSTSAPARDADGRSAQAKLRELWDSLEAEELAEDAATIWPAHTEVVATLLKGTGYSELLSARGDRTAPERTKTLCAVGTVALAEMVWEGGASRRQWSGLFGGASSGTGVLRLSSGCKPPFGVGGMPLALGGLAGALRDSTIFPCAAFKVMRSAAPSANFLFIGKKTGQDDPDFFAGCLASCTTEKGSGLVRMALDGFRSHTKYPCHTGLSDAAAVGLDGASCEPARFPWALVLRPTTEVAGLLAPAKPRRRDESAPTHFLRQARSIAPGTPLYDVFAVATPAAALGDEPSGLVRVGRLVSRSRFIRSAAERQLAFWHQRKEEDYALRPEWGAAHGEHHRLHCGATHFAKLIAGLSGGGAPADLRDLKLPPALLSAGDGRKSLDSIQWDSASESQDGDGVAANSALGALEV